MTDEYRRDTRLVRAGLERSQFQETSEAKFLNSGYVYDSAEERAGMEIADGSIRLSVGLEDLEDLKADLDQALGRG